MVTPHILIPSAALLLCCTSLIPITTGAEYYGRRIGDLMTKAHNVSGRVYAASSKSIIITDFYYDGTGPDAFFWVGEKTETNSNTPDRHGTKIPDEKGSENVLVSYNGKDITLTLPGDLTLDHIRWLSVWCRQFGVDFGSLAVNSVDYPTPQVIGQFSRFAHGLESGDVTVLNSRTIRIEELSYDGSGPDAYFLVGNGAITKSGTKVPDENGSFDILERYQRDTIEITLPADKTVHHIEWLSMYCIQANQDFGNVAIPDHLNVPPYDMNMEMNNCEGLHQRLNVGWRIVDDTIHMELTGTPDEGGYMAFGLSGSGEQTLMLNADITVAYYDSDTPNAVDFNINGYAQCSNGNGVCADTVAGGNNDVYDVSGSRASGIVSVKYTRKLNTGDSEDTAIDGEMYIVWAMGRLSGSGQVLKHDIRTDGNVRINFNRDPEMTCPQLSAPDSESYEPWDIPKLIGDIDTLTIRAQMGPTGGDRGYPAITESASWGIAWYLNGYLIPELVLQIGTEYTFIATGGDDQSNPAKYHPLYITNDAKGGYTQKTTQEKEDVVIYAGHSENDASLGVGPYCEWTPKVEDMWKESETFMDYKDTLRSTCDTQNDAGMFKWTPTNETPPLLYYQCYTHNDLGWKIHITDDVTKFISSDTTSIHYKKRKIIAAVNLAAIIIVKALNIDSV